MLTDQLSVYLVADPGQTGGDLLKVVAAALAGGVTAVQLRAKSGTDREIFHLGSRLRRLSTEHSALFIVNDRVDIALALDADGVHLGVDDLPVHAARSVAPERFVIGYSPADDAEAERAGRSGANYLGIGPVFGTHSKSDAGTAIGLDIFSRRAGLAGIPCIGIGGIDSANAPSVIQAGAVGVAVMSAILRAPDPEQAARMLSCAVRQERANAKGSA